VSGIPPELRPALERCLAAAREARPGLDVRDEDFAAHLAAHAGDQPEAYLGEVIAGDVYLAVACAKGVSAALAVFDRDVLAAVPGWVRHIDASPAFGDEVRQLLAEKLLVGAAPKIADYAGRGALAKWVRVAATRTALNLREEKHGRHERKERVGGDSALDVLPAAGRDAELDVLRARYASELARALKESLAELPEEQRVLLRLHFADGESGERIAALFRVNRSTVSRWIKAAREAILDGTRRRLTERVKLTPAEADSLARALHADLDVSLTSLLGAD
jgi:RNA polymerase sigma-70 factor (ECF subfamily)